MSDDSSNELEEIKSNSGENKDPDYISNMEVKISIIEKSINAGKQPTFVKISSFSFSFNFLMNRL